MKLLYTLAKAVYFPGTFMKGFFEHITCRLLGVKIYAADRYVTRTPLSGHVSMISPEQPYKSFFVCLLPFLGNLLIGLPAFALGVLTLGYMGVDVIDPLSGTFCPMFPVYCLLYLFGSACLCNLFPYHEDAAHMWKMLFGKDDQHHPIGKVLCFIPASLLTGGAFLERYSITFLLSLGLLVYWIVT